MFNSNAFKTSLMFLGIIFLAIAVRTFFAEDSILVKGDGNRETASIGCIIGYKVC